MKLFIKKEKLKGALSKASKGIKSATKVVSSEFKKYRDEAPMRRQREIARLKDDIQLEKLRAQRRALQRTTSPFSGMGGSSYGVYDAPVAPMPTPSAPVKKRKKRRTKKRRKK